MADAGVDAARLMEKPNSAATKSTFVKDFIGALSSGLETAFQLNNGESRSPSKGLENLFFYEDGTIRRDAPQCRNALALATLLISRRLACSHQYSLEYDPQIKPEAPMVDVP